MHGLISWYSHRWSFLHLPGAVPAGHAALPTKPGADARTGSTGYVSNSGILLGSHRLAPQRRSGSRLPKPPLIWMNIPLLGFIPSSRKEHYAGLARHSRQILRSTLTPQVVDELRLLHPGPTDAHREELDKLRPVSPGAAPDVDPDMVRRALASFAATSGAGPSGLRPSHLQDALRYSSGDLTLRLLAEVTSMMIKGELPEDIRQWLCGASLMALRKPNNSLRPVAVGETLRRLCSKVCRRPHGILGTLHLRAGLSGSSDEVWLRGSRAHHPPMDPHFPRRSR